MKARHSTPVLRLKLAKSSPLSQGWFRQTLRRLLQVSFSTMDRHNADNSATPALAMSTSAQQGGIDEESGSISSMKHHHRKQLAWLLSVLFIASSALLFNAGKALSSCASPANAIEAENCLPGTPQSTWDIPSPAGDTSIQGFATNISVNKGSLVQFKVDSPSNSWRLDIYRIGYYGGNGARKVATVNPAVPLPQTQPNCLYNQTTGLTDCGNWAVSASWTVPANATSGIYFARAIRNDTGGASHIIFIVRDDASHSDILFQTADAAWQAYNYYGGQNFYGCGGGNGIVGNFSSNCRAYKISYNRPFQTRLSEPQTWLFNAEYSMVRWLEANGYNVTYSTGVDTDRNGALLLNHKVWMTNGHDEYWSGNQRSNVEAARNAGVNLAFFSGNTIYWKTRWENSIDGSGTPYRTLVCYKETWANAAIDPADPPTWTGTWRDPRFSPPADGGRPENALTGTLTRFASANRGGPITVPQADGKMRFWRNTSIATLAAGQTAQLAPGTLNDELDMDEDNGFRPAGIIHLTTTPVSTTSACLLDFGNTTGACSTVHNVTLYRHASGALVFSTGTYEWSWGLDANHDQSSLGSVTNINMQQATVNLFADMGTQPATLKSGLVPATVSTDQSPPTSIISSPLAGSTVTRGSPTQIAGTATDAGGGVVGGIEISTDNGATWHPATGRASWSYTWQSPTAGTTTIRSRAVDDSGNLEFSSTGVNVTVSGGGSGNGGSAWSDTTVPLLVDAGPDSAVELGVKFRSDTSGYINGIRFYKANTNTGIHIGNLWTSAGTLLATATFTNETASGWQQVNFSTPVAITANTVYVASYHTNVGHYSADLNYFAGNTVDSPPLHFLADGVSGFNGSYAYGSTSSFPNNGWNASNYWVDVAFSAAPPALLANISVTPASPTISTGATKQFTATGTYTDGSTQNITNQTTWTSSSKGVATINSFGLATGLSSGVTTITAALSSVTGNTTLAVQATPLTITTASLVAGTQNVSYSAALTASGGTPPYIWAIVSGSLPTGLSLTSSTGVIAGIPTASGTFNFTVQGSDSAGSTPATRALSIVVTAQQANTTIWPGTAVPGLVDSGPDSAVELGVKFRSDTSGFATGIRFYKASTNTGTHVGNLWSSTGALLAAATFSNETASGWQQVTFSTPVAITANTVYVASYHTNAGHYSADLNYFAGAGKDSPPLHALANGVSGFNGVYAYGSTSSFPSQGWNASNYWVDVVFNATVIPAPTLSSITITPAGLTISAGTTQQFTATGLYSDGSTQNITSQTTWASSNTGIATINSSGLATGVSSGSATISAAQSGKTGSTTLNVQSQSVALTITTASLAGGTLNVSYSATLAASGGTPPYTWTIASGSLPTGLSLTSSTGGISGSPTATGTFNFVAQAADSAGSTPATKALSLNIAAQQASTTIWPGNTIPGLIDSGPDSAVELGVKFRSDTSGFITGIRFYKATANTGTHIGNLWTSTGTQLATATFVNETATGWQQVNFTTPVPITANTIYVASYHTNVGHYSDDQGYFAGNGMDSPPLHALADGISGVNGVYAYGSTSSFPNQGWLESNYWVDVVFSATTP